MMFKEDLLEFIEKKRWVGLSDVRQQFPKVYGTDLLYNLKELENEGKVYCPVGGGWALVKIKTTLKEY
jgi:hypothetical protein